MASVDAAMMRDLGKRHAPAVTPTGPEKYDVCR